MSDAGDRKDRLASSAESDEDRGERFSAVRQKRLFELIARPYSTGKRRRPNWDRGSTFKHSKKESRITENDRQVIYNKKVVGQYLNLRRHHNGNEPSQNVRLQFLPSMTDRKGRILSNYAQYYNNLRGQPRLT